MATEWTERREGALRAMWLEGATAQEIADRLGGVSRSAVMGKVARMKLVRATGHATPGPRATRDQDEQVLEYLFHRDHLRWSYPRIARRFGKGVSAVKMACAKVDRAVTGHSSVGDGTMPAGWWRA